MKILVLGGDGFCGWPTSLHLSQLGHEVFIIDDFSRRRIDVELEVDSLTPIQPLSVRLDAWQRVSGKRIGFAHLDICADYDRVLEVIGSFSPDAIVHFAEQKSAPYSMKSTWHKRYTVSRNTSATTNLLCALLDAGVDAHVIHLGTMGVYGYESAGLMLPEGYVDAILEDPKGRLSKRRILYPFDPGSVYHTTKTLDALLFYYFNKQDGIRVTDLHQGIVWGTSTKDTELSEDLINRFDYDGDFGTVLNRFLIQAAVGFPLTVHGSGGQRRAFINIRDTVRCIELALMSPPSSGSQVRVLNQMTEVHRIRDLARLISRLFRVEVNSVSNPRTEDEENALDASCDGLVQLGLKPTLLEEGLLRELEYIARKYHHRVDSSRIPSQSLWSHRFK
ncbi:MAG: NAD-dependent epimerase/dehydratase family protein [Acidobacteriia bacterium]|nr:NAD-dependent epimerase/dehydratase family protein [Terriglobia bacterium]